MIQRSILFRSWSLWLLLLACAARVSAAESTARIKENIPELEKTRQLIVVRTEGWRSTRGAMELFERAVKGEWRRHAGPFPVVVGRAGLRWGIGLHGEAEGKREGDGCAPAGVFALDDVFGVAPREEARFLKFPYVEATDDLEGVDDPASRHYNRLVKRGSVAADWHSSEKMRNPEGGYRWGVVVRHNWDQKPGYGSCIFLHLWASPPRGTASCTAFAPETMEVLLHWLNRDFKPLLVQLPAQEYAARKSAWSLP